MSDFMLVPAPLLFPFQCSCGNTKGPVIDTFRQRGPDLHEYWCLRCVKDAAIKAGFVDAHEADERMREADIRADYEREIESLQVQLAKARIQTRDTVRHDENISTQLVQAQERIAQLEDVIRNQASQSLGLVGVGSGPEAA